MFTKVSFNREIFFSFLVLRSYFLRYLLFFFRLRRFLSNILLHAIEELRKEGRLTFHNFSRIVTKFYSYAKVVPFKKVVLVKTKTKTLFA